VHQAEVALLDQIEQRHAGRLVLLGDRHDETEVRLHEAPLGLLTGANELAQLALAGRRQAALVLLELGRRLLADLHRLGEARLVILGQQRVLADLTEVQPDQVFLITLCSLLRHVLTFLGMPHARSSLAAALGGVRRRSGDPHGTTRVKT